MITEQLQLDCDALGRTWLETSDRILREIGTLNGRWSMKEKEQIAYGNLRVKFTRALAAGNTEAALQVLHDLGEWGTQTAAKYRRLRERRAAADTVEPGLPADASASEGMLVGGVLVVRSPGVSHTQGDDDD